MKFLLAGLSVGLLALAGLAALPHAILSPRAAKTTGSVRGGVEALVTIIRDKSGVPHIYAANTRDAMYGLGFAHSQDRRLQMEVSKRYARGEAAELTGESGLASDRFMRTMGIARHADAEVSLLSPQDLDLHEAYTAGVNFAARESGWPSGSIASLLHIKDQPWTVSDTLLLLKAASLSYSTQYHEELFAAALEREVGADKLNWYLPAENMRPEMFLLNWPVEDHNPRLGAPGMKRPTFPRARNRAVLPDTLDYAALLAQLRGVTARAAFGSGSNAWVVSGTKSAAGSPMLSSDPHMTMSAPSGIYFAHVVAPDFEVAGVGIPGTLAFYHGVNGKIAWGVTVAGADTQDVYLEELSGSDPNAVRTAAGPAPLAVRREQIAVYGRSQPEQYDVRASAHGPIISDAVPSLLQTAAGDAASRHVLALSITGIEASKPGWYLRLAGASNWDEFREALRSYNGSGFNFLYADAAGHIGYQLAAKLPQRPGGPSTVPTAGWENNGWDGVVDFDSLPRLEDPSSGWIATANASVVGPRFPHYVSKRGGDLSWRVERIQSRLNSQEKLTITDMRAIQLDVVQESMRSVVSWAMEQGGDDPPAAEIRNLLKEWDLAADESSIAQTVAEAFRAELLRKVFEGRLSLALLEAYIAQPLLSSPALDAIMNDGSAAFFGEDPAQARRERQEAVAKAMQRAVEALKGKFGTDRAAWAWGKVHTLTYHSPYAQGTGLTASLLGRILNVGPFSLPGSNTTVNVAYWPLDRWFDVTYAPGYRQIIDLGAVSRSIYLPPPPGQSESSSSPHYKDLARPAVSGTYLTLRWTREQVEQDAAGTMQLHPQ